MNEIASLEKRIESIESRNHKVTADKAWEVSKTRKLIIFVAAYVIVWVFLVWLNAYKP